MRVFSGVNSAQIAKHPSATSSPRVLHVFHTCATRVPHVFHTCSTRVPLSFTAKLALLRRDYNKIILIIKTKAGVAPRREYTVKYSGTRVEHVWNT